ncbi:MAG: redoxin domain-containing protein [Planctomycetota bacterium]
MKTALALTTSALLLLSACGDAGTNAPPASPKTSNSDPGPAPAKAVYEPITAFEHFDAEVFAELREQAAEQGKVLVIDFWATWCGSCVQMFPVLHQAMHEGDRHDHVMLLSVTQDDGEDDIAKALRFVNKQEAGQGAYLQAQDSIDAVAAAINAMHDGDEWAGSALPGVFVFDKEGHLAHAMTQTSGEVTDWVAEIALAADAAAAQ